MEFFNIVSSRREEKSLNNDFLLLHKFLGKVLKKSLEKFSENISKKKFLTKYKI